MYLLKKPHFFWINIIVIALVVHGWLKLTPFLTIIWPHTVPKKDQSHGFTIHKPLRKEPHESFSIGKILIFGLFCPQPTAKRSLKLLSRLNLMFSLFSLYNFCYGHLLGVHFLHNMADGQRWGTGALEYTGQSLSRISCALLKEHQLAFSTWI